MKINRSKAMVNGQRSQAIHIEFGHSTAFAVPVFREGRETTEENAKSAESRKNSRVEPGGVGSNETRDDFERLGDARRESASVSLAAWEQPLRRASIIWRQARCPSYVPLNFPIDEESS